MACAAFPDLDHDWPALREALAHRGIEATVTVWTDPAVAWDAFPLVVGRGAWDNTERPAEFLAWAHSVEAVARLVNPARVLEWNLDKRYLDDLAHDGISVIPTEFVAPGAVPVAASSTTGEIVVKPVISGGGVETVRYADARADGAVIAAHIARLHARGATVMVQPYQRRVDTVGETALVYLGGTFSHAIRKGALLWPNAGPVDRLWEHEVIEARVPRPDQLALAGAALAASERRTGAATTYARIDLVDDDDGRPVVIEVELLDPVLFLGYAEGAADASPTSSTGSSRLRQSRGCSASAAAPTTATIHAAPCTTVNWNGSNVRTAATRPTASRSAPMSWRPARRVGVEVCRLSRRTWSSPCSINVIMLSVFMCAPRIAWPPIGSVLAMGHRFAANRYETWNT